MSAGPSPATSIRDVDARPVSGEAEKYLSGTTIEISQTKKFDKSAVFQSTQIPSASPASSVSREEGCPDGGRTERTCMGLKHKWQERWRMQSAASCENSGSLQQTADPQPCAADKYAMEGVSETNYRPFPQVLQT